MKNMRKSLVHLAVAGGLLGLASASGVVVADMHEEPASCGRTNTGQALIYPYYTVNNNWTTTFEVINTSDRTVAVKVRFHEAKNSRDVLDFNIVMSPYDVWTGWVQKADDGTAQLFTNDTSCTSPQQVSGAKTNAWAYTGDFFDGGGEGNGRAREGYVEVLVMGVGEKGAEKDIEANEDTVPWGAKHVNGTPRDCNLVDSKFVATANAWSPDTDPVTYTGDTTDSLGGSGDPEARDDLGPVMAGFNPLKGNVAWLHAETGVGAGSQAIPVCDWIDGKNYVTAQQFPWFLEPTFASSENLWTVTGVEAFEGQVEQKTTFNTWANNSDTGAVTDWVVTFPTKAYHVDRFNDQIQAAVSKYRNGNVAITDDTPAPGIQPFDLRFNDGDDEEVVTGDSKVGVTFNLFDREEKKAIDDQDTSISPAPPPDTFALRFEANVIQFGAEPVLDSPLAFVQDATSKLGGAKNGWAELVFTKELPVAAFAIKERDRGESGTAYGQAMNHGYGDAE